MPRFSIRSLMWAVLLAAFVAASLANRWLFLLYTTGPAVGAIVHRTRGGTGIFGGAVGGVLSYWCIGAALFLQFYLRPRPSLVGSLGPVLTFSLLAVYGVLFGLLVGVAAWGLAGIAGRLSLRWPKSRERRQATA